MKSYTPLRRFYAWIGFITTVIVVFAILYSLVLVFTSTERPEPFYQQTSTTYL